MSDILRTYTILAVDVGNTSTAVAIVRRGNVIALSRMFTAQTSEKKVSSLLAKLLRKMRVIDGAIISSVVPAQNSLWLKMLKAFNPLLLTSKLKLGFKAKYPAMHTLGADRIANISAAIVKYKAPMIIVDIGTAVTFDVVNFKKEFIGGVIAPGPALFLNYMAEKTAKLPKIGITSLNSNVPVVGKNTEDAMLASLIYGYPAMLYGVLEAIESKEFKNCLNVSIVITGGFADKIVFSGKKVKIDSHLIFEGLYRIWLLNSLNLKITK